MLYNVKLYDRIIYSYICSSTSKGTDRSVTEMLEEAVARTGLRGRRAAMEDGGCEMVRQALVAGRRMLELVVESERLGSVPDEEELTLVVMEAQEEGEVAGLVMENLARAALHYWTYRHIM